MGTDVASHGSEPIRPAGTSPARVDPYERMADLAWRAARGAGLSEQASTQVCQDVLADVPAARQAPQRGVRTGVLAALRHHLAPAVDAVHLERALRDAVLWDEVALLPPRQRLVLTRVAGLRMPVSAVARDTGWSPDRVVCLLRAALRTVTVHRDWA